MEKLIAEFSVKLPSFVLLSGPQNENYQSHAIIDGFDVTVSLIPYTSGMTSKATGDQYMTFGSIEAKILVSRDESISPPDFTETNNRNSSRL